MSHHPCGFCGRPHFGERNCPDATELAQVPVSKPLNVFGLRYYTDKETPKVGDVIRLFEGAFGTGVIASVKKVPGVVQNNLAGSGVVVTMNEYTVYRPFVQFKSGVPVPATEVYTLREGSLREKGVYTTDSHNTIDNRNI